MQRLYTEPFDPMVPPRSFGGVVRWFNVGVRQRRMYGYNSRPFDVRYTHNSSAKADLPVCLTWGSGRH